MCTELLGFPQMFFLNNKNFEKKVYLFLTFSLYVHGGGSLNIKSKSNSFPDPDPIQFEPYYHSISPCPLIKVVIVFMNFLCTLSSVLRIHSILMRSRILDPHWKKLDPDPNPIRIRVISLRFTEFFLQKIIFKFFVLFFRIFLS